MPESKDNPVFVPQRPVLVRALRDCYRDHVYRRKGDEFTVVGEFNRTVMQEIEAPTPPSRSKTRPKSSPSPDDLL